ncbi:MAG TPA: DUF5681 domain-containing protein [Clostridia bacterium]|nr:DUF5681 domain-containing protein [Clostridia bacterium]
MAGRPPKEKSFANMLNIAIKEAHDEGRDKLRAVADKLVELAINGDMQAINAIADRLDGKPAQAIIGDCEADPIHLVTEIRRTIVRPGS